MSQGRHVARDVSYASSAQSKGGRAIIRLMENATGRLRLIKRVEGYEREVGVPHDGDNSVHPCEGFRYVGLSS